MMLQAFESCRFWLNPHAEKVVTYRYPGTFVSRIQLSGTGRSANGHSAGTSRCDFRAGC